MYLYGKKKTPTADRDEIEAAQTHARDTHLARLDRSYLVGWRNQKGSTRLRTDSCGVAYSRLAMMASTAPPTNCHVNRNSSNTRPDTTAERMIDSDAAKLLRMLSAYLHNVRPSTRQVATCTLDHSSDKQSAQALQDNDRPCDPVVPLEEPVRTDLHACVTKARGTHQETASRSAHSDPISASTKEKSPSWMFRSHSEPLQL